jgi:hypothetical protein
MRDLDRRDASRRDDRRIRGSVGYTRQIYQAAELSHNLYVRGIGYDLA